MYRHGAVRFLTALLAGIALHAGMALLERIIPGLGTGLDPFLRLVPALLTSVLAAGSLRRSDRFRSVTVGAVAAGLTGFFGMIVASLIWLPGGHLLPAIASVTGTSVLVGILGGLAGYQRARVRNPEPLPGRPAESYPEVQQTR